MWTTSLVMAPLWLASGSVGTAYEAGLRAELRTRPVEGRAADLELVPGLGLERTQETLTLGLRYAPVLRLTLEPGAPLQSPNLLHGGQLSALWRLDSISQLSATQSASYGVNEFDLLSSPGGAPLPLNDQGPEPLPLGPVRRYVSSDSALAWTRALSLRSSVELGARYQVSGSLAPESRETLPLQHGPTLQARFSHALTRRDALLTQASATHATFSSEEEASTAQLSQGWRRQLSPTVDGQVALGAAALRSLTPGAPRTGVRAMPLAEAELGYTPALRDAPLSARVSARYAPFIDRVSGEAYGRAEASLALAWAPRAWLQLATRASGARTLSDGARASSQLAGVEASATWRASPTLSLSAGARSAWDAQALADGTVARRHEAGGFVTFTVLAREVL